MAEDPRHHEHTPEMEYEHQDLSPWSVYIFLIGLAVAGIVVYFALWGFYNFLEAREKGREAPPNPLVQPSTTDSRVVPPDAYKKFPQPRLERNERLEINEFLLHEEQTLESYDWVDQKAGVVRIPIERAMQLIAQQGLPTAPKSGTVPASEVNTVNQAAQRSDTSGVRQGKKQ
jgi:hypothetical protein